MRKELYQALKDRLSHLIVTDSGDIVFVSAERMAGLEKTGNRLNGQSSTSACGTGRWSLSKRRRISPCRPCSWSSGKSRGGTRWAACRTPTSPSDYTC